MNAPLRRTAYVIVAAFALLALSATYFQAIAGPSFRDDPRNPRLAAWRIGRERGTIVTSDGVVVARSDPDQTDSKLFRRSYPEGDLYSHLVGYVSVLFGTRGLEATHAKDLISDRDATISGVLNVLLGGDPRPRGLRLTIDSDLQAAAHEALDGQRGAVVAIDPRTGAVLASVSTPGFDPNALIGADAAEAGAALENDPEGPLIDRAIGRTYPPGSIFKVVTTTAGLESGLVGPSTTFDDPVALELPGTSATIRNYDRQPCHDGDTVTLEVAFVRSCNTVFGRLGMDLGAALLTDAAEGFGFNSSVPYELDVTTSGMPLAASYADDPPAMAQNAIGQRDVRATSMEMALVAAAVANEGRIMIPYVVADVFTSEGSIERQTEPVLWRRAMSPASAAVLRDLMEQVVISGTGRKAAVPGIRIAGKTGTAEVEGQPPHAWFIGFGPVDAGSDRQIALAVVVESGGNFGETATGGSVAAPIARRVVEQYLSQG